MHHVPTKLKIEMVNNVVIIDVSKMPTLTHKNCMYIWCYDMEFFPLSQVIFKRWFFCFSSRVHIKGADDHCKPHTYTCMCKHNG